MPYSPQDSQSGPVIHDLEMQEDKPQDAHVRVVKVRVFGRPKDFTTRFICESDVPRLSCGGLNLEILPEIFKMEGCFEV